MKKRILTLALSAAVLVGITSSCQSLLDIKETDFIAGDIALRTVANNESLVLGSYAVYNPEMYYGFNGVFSDELKKGEFYNSETVHEWRFAYDDVTMRDNFTAITGLYRVIDRANRVLTALPGAVAVNPTDEALRSRVKGEALFLRALAQFDLFRYYCENYSADGLAMPYMLSASLETQARIKMGDYFTLLLKDLTDAKALLPNNLTDKARANYLAAVGLHARVALYMRNWSDAEKYSTEFINALPLSSAAQFDDLWHDKNTNEVAFMLVRNTGNRAGSFYRPLFTRNAAGQLQVGSITWYPSDKLWNSFDKTNDVRFKTYLIDEPILKDLNRHSYLVKKYEGTGYQTTNENVSNAKILRTGEMYLIRAEARAEQDKVSGVNSAEADLNALRAARITGYSNVTLSSKASAITEVISERFKELAFEGHRFWDLKRRGLAVERTGDDIPSTSAATLPANSFRFVLPIPKVEMDANPKMVQNNGYN